LLDVDCRTDPRPIDRDNDIAWPEADPLLSPKDAVAQ
jgi:hypothetical protein